jgi:hypothetical protein
MCQTNDSVISKDCTRRLHKLKGHRLRLTYLNPHLGIATTTGKGIGLFLFHLMKLILSILNERFMI